MKARLFVPVLLSSVLMSGCMLHSQAKEKRAVSQATTFDGNVALSSLMSLVDTRISGIAGMLSVAALTEEVRSGDWTRMKPLLAEIQKSGGEAIVWFALPDGTYSTVDKDKMDQNIKDRPYFPKVMAGGKSIGELVVSKSTGKMSAVIAVPVSDGKTVTGMLGVSLFLQKYGPQIKQEMALPDSTIFFALNRDRMTVFHVDPSKVFADPSAQGSESMTRAIQEMLSKAQGVVEYDFGGPRRMMFRRSEVTGWWYVLGAPIAK